MQSEEEEYIHDVILWISNMVDLHPLVALRLANQLYYNIMNKQYWNDSIVTINYNEI